MFLTFCPTFVKLFDSHFPKNSMIFVAKSQEIFESRRFWFFFPQKKIWNPGNFLMIFFWNFIKKLIVVFWIIFGNKRILKIKLQKICELLKIDLQTCENVWRNLVECLNSQRFKSLKILWISSRAFWRVFACKNRLRYSRERASKSLPKISQQFFKTFLKS